MLQSWQRHAVGCLATLASTLVLYLVAPVVVLSLSAGSKIQSYCPQVLIPGYFARLADWDVDALPKGPNYLYSRMQGFYSRNYYYDLGKYPP